MKRLFLISLLALAPAFAQSPAERAPTFEVASIRPSQLTPGQVTAGVHIDGAQVNCLLLSLRDYIRWAYSVKDYQIVAPDWMAGARFDINAKLSAKATGKQVAAMVGNLLVDRFQLKFHRETRELPVYALIVAKGGPKLTESPKDPEPAGNPDNVSVVANGDSSGSTVDTGDGGSFNMGSNRLEGKKFAMDTFAETLSRFSDRPIVDFTGLKGSYDFSLEFTPEDFRMLMLRAAVQQGIPLPPEALQALDSASPDMSSALEKLGLRLDPRKTSVEVLVIDHMEKAPSEN